MTWNVLFRRRPRPGVDCWPAESDNLYHLWMTSPRRIALSRLPPLGFTPSEINAAATWSERQKSCGMRADIAGDILEDTQVLEVFGPDNTAPHCIVYPTHAGFQVDEFTGDSMVYPCLETALQEIAPLH